MARAPLWQYLIPKYGNYGGPGWSGGAMMSNYDEVNWIDPVDSLDDLFYQHDRTYQEAIRDRDNGAHDDYEMNLKWLEADKILTKSIDDLPINPDEWPRQPKNKFYGWLYRKLAIYGFTFKVWLYGFKYKPNTQP